MYDDEELATNSTAILQLRAERQRRHLNQSDVARMIGVGTPLLCRWETGRTSPTLRSLDRWAAVLGMEISASADAVRRGPDRSIDLKAIAEAIELIENLWNGDARPSDVLRLHSELVARFGGRIALLNAPEGPEELSEPVEEEAEEE